MKEKKWSKTESVCEAGVGAVSSINSAFICMLLYAIILGSHCVCECV